ncbi:hypothetical protein DPMN_185576 [Dreissena polymorpha]|uniref:Uncharacterized protein n=1 Tax=Dreissena polymorpha TaxID=45954 RepID=A0A9D4DKN2_DREPO|nr:hypothetical protein DPMN_185576 [Dreissena polymorpha]
MNLMDTASLARQRPQSTGMDTAVFHTVTGTTGGDTMRMTRYPYNQLLGDDDSDHSNSLSLINDHCQDSDSDDRFMKYYNSVTKPDKDKSQQLKSIQSDKPDSERTGSRMGFKGCTHCVAEIPF